MKHYVTAIILGVGLLVAAPAYALTIFACEPEWAALAREIGGEEVEVFAATSARENPHYIRARPSLIAAMRRADLVICSGAGLEVGWLPILLHKAGSAQTQPGGIGHLLAAEQVPVLDKPQRLDRADGDVHPEGNPHLHLNPHHIAAVATELTARLTALEPGKADAYRAGYESFSRRWQEAIARWEKAAAPLTGMRVVVHHQSFAYLLDWLKMEQAAALEPKPGLPPTAAHLESLLQSLQARPAQAIIRTPYEPVDASQWLAEKTQTPALILPYTVGGDTLSHDLFALFDRTLALLAGVADAQ